jgi:hypothetical protein
MPENPNNSTSGETSSAPEPRSLREVAESTYEEISSGGSEDYSPGEESDATADRGDGRNRRGRFVARDQQPQDTGEAEAEPPSPDETTTETQERPDPARGNQPPEHWSAEDKALYQRLPPDAKSFLTRRYSEMEADYTRKSQANAEAVQVTQALNPVFNDPEIMESLKLNNMHPVQAIYDWARLHKAAVSQNVQTRASVLYEIAERMGFDPAKVFARPSPPVDLPPEKQNDPAVRYFAELQGRANSDLQALRAELNQFKAQENQRIEAEALQVTRSSIDAFADEKGPDGRPLRPHFDKVIGHIISMFKENPQRDIREAYETACWMHPEVRKVLMTEEQNRARQQQSNQRAMQATRSNVRGITSPVSKPAGPPAKKGNGTLRDTLEASAEEVGF